MKRILLSLITMISWLTMYTVGCNPAEKSSLSEGPIASSHKDPSPLTYPIADSSAQASTDPLSHPAPATLAKTDTIEKSSHAGFSGGGGGKSKGLALPTPTAPAPVLVGEAPADVPHVEGITGGLGGSGGLGTFDPIRGFDDDDDGHHAICGNRILEGDEECDDGNQFDDDACSNECKITDTRDCSFHKSSTGSYIFCENEAYTSWQQAHANCLAYGPFDLTSISGTPENNYIQSLLGPDSAWIGLNDLAQEGTFVWSNGNPVIYTNWAPGEPNNFGGDQDCAHMYTYGLWDDDSCSLTKPYVCEAIFQGPVDE